MGWKIFQQRPKSIVGGVPGRAGGVPGRGWRSPWQGLEVCLAGAGGVLGRDWRCAWQGLEVYLVGAGGVPLLHALCHKPREMNLSFISEGYNKYIQKNSRQELVVSCSKIRSSS